jgi:hypothetical protein
MRSLLNGINESTTLDRPYAVERLWHPLLGSERTMKTAGSGNQNRYATMRSKPSIWTGRLEEILLIHAGWKARRTYQVLAAFPRYR